MPSTRESERLDGGYIVPPRIVPAGHGLLMALFEAIEDSAPEAFEDLRDNVLRPTIERLGPIETGSEIEGRWSGSLELWQERYNLHRWKNGRHRRSFSFVAHAVLEGLETAGQMGEPAWRHFKDAMSLTLSPRITAPVEWRILEEVDPDLARELTIQPPRLKVWNPVLESVKTWRDHVDRQLDEYQQEVEAVFRREGAEHRSTKRKTREHLEWLVRYQVREEEYAAIGDAIDAEQAEQGRARVSAEARVRKAIPETARLIGLKLRGKRGRPGKASS